MPELPEVETIRRGLADLIVNRRIMDVQIIWPKSLPVPAETVATYLRGATIVGISRRAKLLLINLSTNWTMLVHLKMTGQLVFVNKTTDYRFGAGHPNDSLIGKLPDRSTRVIFDLTTGYLFFNDQRKFGWIKPVPTPAVTDLAFFQTLGPEPLEPDFSPDNFQNRLRRKAKSSIKAALLDQTVLAGVGNIYADEALWAAQIHPQTKAGSVSPHQLNDLLIQIKAVLQKSIDHGGSSNQTYIDAHGNRGTYLDFANIYRRTGQACRRCGTVVIKIRVAGRGSHICPLCQILA